MKKLFLRIATMLLVVTMLVAPLSSCAGGKKMLTLTADGKTYSISVNLYELMLSAMKGTLAAYGYTLEGLKPSHSAYWDIMDTYDGQTMETSDSYYRKTARAILLRSICLTSMI